LLTSVATVAAIFSSTAVRAGATTAQSETPTGCRTRPRCGLCVLGWFAQRAGSSAPTCGRTGRRTRTDDPKQSRVRARPAEPCFQHPLAPHWRGVECVLVTSALEVIPDIGQQIGTGRSVAIDPNSDIKPAAEGTKIPQCNDLQAHRGVVSFGEEAHRQRPTRVQNDSGLAQGLAGCSAAG
jgi:hypothetical protein